MNNLHFITANPWEHEEKDAPHRITFKIRHTPEFNYGTIHQVDGVWRIEADEKIHGVAPGQYCVVYDADHHICYGSGEID